MRLLSWRSAYERRTHTSIAFQLEEGSICIPIYSKHVGIGPAFDGDIVAWDRLLSNSAVVATESGSFIVEFQTDHLALSHQEWKQDSAAVYDNEKTSR